MPNLEHLAWRRLASFSLGWGSALVLPPSRRVGGQARLTEALGAADTEAPTANQPDCFVRNGVRRCHPKATHQATATYDVHAVFQNDMHPAA
jgi:hypothetical protein